MATIDPRGFPELGCDSHLPPVAADRLTEQGLRQRFIAPPVWSPEVAREPVASERQPTLAAVLLPLVLRDRLTLLLTQRAGHLPTHAGQIAFPGGKIDPSDEDAIAAALREAREEVGLHPSHVEVLGVLPSYLTGTSFAVTPVVALVRPGFELTPNPAEVDAVFEVPLAFLMDPANHRRHAIEWEGRQREWFSMPYRDGDTERFIWGATAGMLRNFYRLLSA